MILLVFVTIWIFKKYKELALSKGYTDESKKWGWHGVMLYLGVGFSCYILLILSIVLGYFNLTEQDFVLDFVMTLMCYGAGGLAAYIGYNQYSDKPDKRPDLGGFGTDEELNEGDLDD